MSASRLVITGFFGVALAAAPAFAAAAVLTQTSSQAGALNCNPQGIQNNHINAGGSFSESSSTSTLHGSYGYASASLATGKIRIYGSNAFSSSCAVAGGSGAFQDLITINLPDGMGSTEIEFSLSIDGESSSPSSYDLGSANMNIDGISTYFALGQIRLADMYGKTLRYKRTVTDGEQIDINIYLNAFRLSDGGVIDLSHTAAFGLALPTGATFTSQSGVFLTQAGVPEPGSWALLLLGFCAVGSAARLRNRKASSP